MSKYRSNAQWPLDVYKGMFGDGISSDDHQTAEMAQSVCKGLEKDGFGGEGKHFPIKTWVSINVSP